ncbi:hypothetical protein ACFQDE_11415 [Deinococcus caeni]|uniref:Uncharacterized protein n=1 Tax=Deinococcus caeni TaxID=569127 RepID=A0ABP9UB86_9DEIO
MALTSQREGTSRESQIDRLLHIAAVEWLTLPEKLREFHEWEDLEQMDFMLEWDLTERRMRELLEFARGGEMNSDQFGLMLIVADRASTLMPSVVELFAEYDMVGEFLHSDELSLSA